MQLYPKLKSPLFMIRCQKRTISGESWQKPGLSGLPHQAGWTLSNEKTDKDGVEIDWNLFIRPFQKTFPSLQEDQDHERDYDGLLQRGKVRTAFP